MESIWVSGMRVRAVLAAVLTVAFAGLALFATDAGAASSRRAAPVSISVVAAMALSLPTLSVATDGAAVRHCSNANTPEELFLVDITARDVSCAVALRFIVAISKHRDDLKTQNTRYAGYLCRPRPEGVATWIRCTRGRRVIGWSAGT
jgi:hypothetical protein